MIIVLKELNLQITLKIFFKRQLLSSSPIRLFKMETDSLDNHKEVKENLLWIRQKSYMNMIKHIKIKILEGPFKGLLSLLKE